jgi:hypothetical protein
MLQRLAARGLGSDAATSEDFAAVRALEGWEALAASVSGLPAAAVPDAAGKTAPSRPDAPAAAGRPAAPAVTSAVTANVAPVTADAAEPAVTGDARETLRVSAAPVVPVGLAYDRVSDRFLVGDREARRLTVVDGGSSRVANLVAARTAGFGRVGAFEIDVRQGDLWVVSSSGEGEARTATLHKLQLISGRVLYALPVPAERAPSEFVDVAVTAAGEVLALDAAGHRVFVVAPRARTIGAGVPVDVPDPTSLAPADGRVAYVAHSGGVRRVDLASGRGTAVQAGRGVDLIGIERLRWYRNGLMAVQRVAGGSYRVVRIGLDPTGRRVTGLAVLDRDLHMADPTAATLSGDRFYYLAASASGVSAAGEAEAVVKQVTAR